MTMKIIWINSFFVFTPFLFNLFFCQTVSYHTCKVRSGIGKWDIEDFEKKRGARSISAECFRICYALMTKTKYYTNTCLAGTNDYDRWFKIFRCPKQIRNPVLIPEGVVPDEFKPKTPTDLCPGWEGRPS